MTARGYLASGLYEVRITCELSAKDSIPALQLLNMRIDTMHLIAVEIDTEYDNYLRVLLL